MCHRIFLRPGKRIDIIYLWQIWMVSPRNEPRTCRICRKWTHSACWWNCEVEVSREDPSSSKGLSFIFWIILFTRRKHIWLVIRRVGNKTSVSRCPSSVDEVKAHTWHEKFDLKIKEQITHATNTPLEHRYFIIIILFERTCCTQVVGHFSRLLSTGKTPRFTGKTPRFFVNVLDRNIEVFDSMMQMSSRPMSLLMSNNTKQKTPLLFACGFRQHLRKWLWELPHQNCPPRDGRAARSCWVGWWRRKEC